MPRKLRVMRCLMHPIPRIAREIYGEHTWLGHEAMALIAAPSVRRIRELMREAGALPRSGENLGYDVREDYHAVEWELAVTHPEQVLWRLRRTFLTPADGVRIHIGDDPWRTMTGEAVYPARADG